MIGREHFDRFVADNGLDACLAAQSLDLDDPHSFDIAATAMRSAVEHAVIAPATRAQLRAAWAWLKGGCIVRSSAIGEDAQTDSFAGQLDSVLDVRTIEQLEQAVRTCWASYWSARALFYQRARARPLRGMGVVIQRMIDATLGGVLFTRSPTDVDSIAIEYVHGHPGELVAGAVEPRRLMISRATTPHSQQQIDAPFPELIAIGLRLEQALGGPQDIEWVVDRADQLWIVQSRAITTPMADPRTRQLFSNVNVNENYPRPLSPLLYSIAAEAYENYFRNLGRLLGVREALLAQLECPLRHCVGVHGARLYYNLSNIHRAILAVPFGTQFGAAFDAFVGVDDENRSAAPRPATRRAKTRPRDVLRIISFGLRALWTLPARVVSFEARVDAFVKRCDKLADASIEQLQEHFHGFLDIRFRGWADASLADLSATLGYAWLCWTLRRTLGPDAARKLPQTLLLAIPNVVSAAQIEALWTLSRLARADTRLREAFARLAIDDPDALLQQIRTPGLHDDFCVAFDSYLREHGFRISGELMLSTHSYAERPTTLLPVLAPYLDIEGPSPQAATAAMAIQRDHGIATVSAQLNLLWRPMFRLALRATQRAISYRERARQRQALLYARLRAIIRELGLRLELSGRLEHADDLTFLSWREIDDWLGGHAMFPAIVKDLIALRRRAYACLAMQHPPDTVRLPVGAYLDNVGERETVKGLSTSPTTLHGVGVAGGRAVGSARVLRDLSEAGQFERGDCLVTRQTDPGWAPLFFLARGLVMERGGMLSHGAIVAREFGIPGVIAVPDATRILRSGERIEVDGDHGQIQRLDQPGQEAAHG